MSFQAYIDNITKATNETPTQIKDHAIRAGILNNNLTATVFCEWLAKEYQLGRGHSMALWKLFVEEHWIEPKKTRLKT